MHARLITLSLVCLSVGSLVFFGCPGSHTRPDGDGDGDSDIECDSPRDDRYEVLEELRTLGTPEVDILFVVDNSNSMAEEQRTLADQVVVMVQELISPSTEGMPSVRDLHIGIVTTDMGTHGTPIQTCSNPSGGDGGVLQNIGRLDGCEASYSAADCDRAECPWLVHSSEYPDDDPGSSPIWEDFGCIAVLGTGGCGFEQQLEASYQALVENTAPGMPNEGFLREDSLLAIIYVTDEDDCSTPDPEMFNPANETLGSLNTRCALDENEDRLYAISRYHDAFVDLRDGDEDRVVVAAIAGVPVDGSWNPGDPLERLRDLRRVNPSNPAEMISSCDTAMGRAKPPVRLAELVYAFGNNGILESICREDWTPALRAITRKIQDKLIGLCSERAMAELDFADCRVVEVLADESPCPNPADSPGPDRSTGWQVDLGTVESEGECRRQCEILPADYDEDGCPDGDDDCGLEEWLPHRSDALQGWFYDPDFAICEHGQLRMTHRDVASADSTVRFECLR